MPSGSLLGGAARSTIRSVVMRLLQALRRREEPPVEQLDVEAIRSRIGDPLPPPKAAEAPYTRTDGRPVEQRSWRKIAGLTR